MGNSSSSSSKPGILKRVKDTATKVNNTLKNVVDPLGVFHDKNTGESKLTKINDKLKNAVDPLNVFHNNTTIEQNKDKLNDRVYPGKPNPMYNDEQRRPRGPPHRPRGPPRGPRHGEESNTFSPNGGNRPQRGRGMNRRPTSNAASYAP